MTNEAQAAITKQLLQKYIPLLAVAAGLVFSFFLPNAAANVMDARMLDNLIIIEAESISFETELEMSLTDRLTLISSSNSEVISLATGHAMNIDSAKVSVIRELGVFFGDKLLGFKVEGSTVEEGNAVFVIEADNPAVNMIIWEFRVIDSEGNEATVTLDDETGIILKLIYQRKSVAINQNSSEKAANIIMGNIIERDELYETAQRLSELMSEYYGVPVRLGDYQLGSNIAYYRADMYERGFVIPMYGVVRANSFTINERL